MRLSFTILAALTSAVLAVPNGKIRFKPEDIIERDVVVLGGGAAGTYAAIRVRDAGKSVVVIEKDVRLGGHVHTYSPPGSPVALDFGVLAYLELPGVRDFFARFGIDLMPAPNPGFQTQYVDFSTGRPVTSGNSVQAAANPQAMQQALGTYGQLAAQYLNFTFPSLIQLPVGKDMPEDLLLPFGKFVEKYNLQAALPTIWGFTNWAGDVLREPTAFILNHFSAVHLNATANKGLLLPTTLNNSVLYDKAAHFLGPDVLFSTTVTHAKRTDTSVRLVVHDSNGCPKLIRAKKLIVTIPPLPSILAPLRPDERELSVFARWIHQSAYVGVLANTGLPDGLDVVNAVPDSSPHTLNLPGAGGVSYIWNFIFSAFPGLYRTNIIGAPDLTADGAKALVTEALAKFGEAGTFNVTEQTVWLAFGDHTPLQVRGKAVDIAKGFYQQAFALNGYKSTFYAGAAWASDYTSVHWTYLETVILPLVFKALES